MPDIYSFIQEIIPDGSRMVFEKLTENFPNSQEVIVELCSFIESLVENEVDKADAIEVLGLYRSIESINSIANAVDFANQKSKDSSHPIKTSSCFALMNIGSPKCVPLLIKILMEHIKNIDKSEKQLLRLSPSLKNNLSGYQAIIAISKIGGDEAYKILYRITNNEFGIFSEIYNEDAQHALNQMPVQIVKQKSRYPNLGAVSISSQPHINVREKHVAEDWFQKGNKALNERELENAIKFYNNAKQIIDDMSVNNQLGLVYVEKNLYDTALNYYRQALVFEPNSETVYFNMSIAYSKIGDGSKSIICVKKAALLGNIRAQEILTNLNISEDRWHDDVDLTNVLIRNYSNITEQEIDAEIVSGLRYTLYRLNFDKPQLPYKMFEEDPVKYEILLQYGEKLLYEVRSKRQLNAITTMRIIDHYEYTDNHSEHTEHKLSEIRALYTCNTIVTKKKCSQIYFKTNSKIYLFPLVPKDDRFLKIVQDNFKPQIIHKEGEFDYSYLQEEILPFVVLGGIGVSVALSLVIFFIWDIFKIPFIIMVAIVLLIAFCFFLHGFDEPFGYKGYRKDLAEIDKRKDEKE